MDDAIKLHLKKAKKQKSPFKNEVDIGYNFNRRAKPRMGGIPNPYTNHDMDGFNMILTGVAPNVYYMTYNGIDPIVWTP